MSKEILLDETNISQETHNAILAKFPMKYKIPIVHLLMNDRSRHDQIFIIYYNDFKDNLLFSFEHLCRVLNDITDIPINRIIARFRQNNEWSLSEITADKLEFIVEKLLSM